MEQNHLCVIIFIGSNLNITNKFDITIFGTKLSTMHTHLQCLRNFLESTWYLIPMNLFKSFRVWDFHSFVCDYSIKYLMKSFQCRLSVVIWYDLLLSHWFISMNVKLKTAVKFKYTFTTYHIYDVFCRPIIQSNKYEKENPLEIFFFIGPTNIFYFFIFIIKKKT